VCLLYLCLAGNDIAATQRRSSVARDGWSSLFAQHVCQAARQINAHGQGSEYLGSRRQESVCLGRTPSCELAVEGTCAQSSHESRPRSVVWRHDLMAVVRVDEEQGRQPGACVLQQMA
jgi:hypothetical protein